MKEMRQSDLKQLTARQREFYELILLGNSIKELAEKARCSPRTAQFHTSNVLRKMGVENKPQLIAQALAHLRARYTPSR